MLIRVGGGVEGIKDYLEDGRKQGRGFSRDELDERVILAGDLEAVDALIDSMDIAGEKYLHITMSFKEDEVSRETLQDIVRDFERFAFAAYRPDEYAFYAEAHLPRLKSYENAQTGELVERKPHIHVVIPTANLLSGGHLNPLGAVSQNLSFIDAFQEHINDRYGLASPKDNRRVEFTSESEILSRHKGDLFDAQGKELKGKLLDAMLERGVQRYEDFVALVREHGEQRTRNAGRADAYENLKVLGAARGINLKDFVFQREFIELSTADKKARLAQELGPKYETAGQARPSPAERQETLADWERFRAREIKYINSGNRRLWQAYRAARPAERDQLLKEREQRFYARHHRQEPDHGRRSEPAPDLLAPKPWERDYPYKGHGHERAPGRGAPEHLAGQHDLGSAPSLAQAQSLHDLRDLPRVSLDGRAQPGSVLLPTHASNHLEHGQAERADPLRRRDADPASGLRAPGAAPSNVVGQLRQDLAAQQTEAAGDSDEAWRALKQQIDAKRLLEELSRSHGVLVAKYPVTLGRDGADRIQCGARKLNVSDFLTRELHLPWPEAAQILKRVHALQKELDPVAQPRVAPQPELWREFGMQRRRAQVIERAAGIHSTQKARLKGRAAITRAYQAARSQAGALPPAQRRAQISLARMTRLLAEAQLREELRTRRVFQQAQAGRSDWVRYRDFLAEKALLGDEVAIKELRRLGGPRPDMPAILGNSIESANRDPARWRDFLHRQAGLTFTVETNGDVVYRRSGAQVIRDTAKQVRVLTEDKVTIETALRLAQQRFGSSLTIAGSRRFQERVAQAAAESRLTVRFTDERLNRAMQAHRAQLDAAARPKPPTKDLDRS